MSIPPSEPALINRKGLELEHANDDIARSSQANQQGVSRSLSEQLGAVTGKRKISGSAVGIVNSDWFGWSAAHLGDLDQDGNDDIAVGAVVSDDPGIDTGAVYVLFLKADGTVKGYTKISNEGGGMQGRLDTGERFGSSISGSADLDGDGIRDFAVGSYAANGDGVAGTGGVWLLMMYRNGNVRASKRIGHGYGGLQGNLAAGAQFGEGVSWLDDLDGDEIPDLAVGAPYMGSVWVLRLHRNGTVKGEVRIGQGSGGFKSIASSAERFGDSVACIGDLNGDSTSDLAVGVYWDNDGGSKAGSIWILFLASNGSVIEE